MGRFLYLCSDVITKPRLFVSALQQQQQQYTRAAVHKAVFPTQSIEILSCLIVPEMASKEGRVSRSSPLPKLGLLDFRLPLQTLWLHSAVAEQERLPSPHFSPPLPTTSSAEEFWSQLSMQLPPTIFGKAFVELLRNCFHKNCYAEENLIQNMKASYSVFPFILRASAKEPQRYKFDAL